MNLALFDLDGTLIPGDSDHAFGEFMITLGWVGAELHRRRNDEFYRQYQAGCLDITATSSSPPTPGAGARWPSNRPPAHASLAR